MLSQLIYCSEGTNPDNIETGIEITKEASEFNATKGITGILVVHKKHYLQCIEGNSLELNLLFQKISKDARHKNVQLLYYNSTLKRDFTNWFMVHIEEKIQNRDIFFNFSEDFRFNPEILTGQGSLIYLKELAAMHSN